jgi:GTPase Era involved in 16S rRNA processing
MIYTDVFTSLNWDKYFRRIGIEANEELRSIFKRDVHLILQVRVAKRSA